MTDQALTYSLREYGFHMVNENYERGNNICSKKTLSHFLTRTCGCVLTRHWELYLKSL